MNKTTLESLITRKELRALLNISQTTEWRWLRDDLLPEPFIVRGKILGYLKSNYLEWIEINSSNNLES